MLVLVCPMVWRHTAAIWEDSKDWEEAESEDADCCRGCIDDGSEETTRGCCNNSTPGSDGGTTVTCLKLTIGAPNLAPLGSENLLENMNVLQCTNRSTVTEAMASRRRDG